MSLDLPKDLAKGDLVRTATTPAEYVDLTFRGFVAADGPATASLTYDELTPAQKAARTRKLNQEREQSQYPDVDIDAQSGDANLDTDQH